jgi:hypothetical protein
MRTTIALREITGINPCWMNIAALAGHQVLFPPFVGRYPTISNDIL